MIALRTYTLPEGDDGVSLLTCPPDGIYIDVPESVYRRIDALNQSAAKVGHAESLLDMRHAMDNPKPPTEAMLLGTAAHEYALEPVSYTTRSIVTPMVGRQSTDGRRVWEASATELVDRAGCADEWAEAVDKAGWKPYHDEAFALACKMAGRTMVKPDWLALIRAMGDALLAHPIIGKALSKGGYREVMFIWTDPATGIRCKGRLDLWNPSAALTIDIKTASRMGPAKSPYPGLIKIVRSLGYAFQAAWYEWGFGLAAQAMGRTDTLVMEFGFVQTVAPHHCALVNLADADIEGAKRDIAEVMPRIRKAMDSGVWPGFPAHIPALAARPMWDMTLED